MANAWVDRALVSARSDQSKDKHASNYSKRIHNSLPRQTYTVTKILNEAVKNFYQPGDPGETGVLMAVHGNIDFQYAKTNLPRIAFLGVLTCAGGWGS